MRPEVLGAYTAKIISAQGQKASNLGNVIKFPERSSVDEDAVVADCEGGTTGQDAREQGSPTSHCELCMVVGALAGSPSRPLASVWGNHQLGEDEETPSTAQMCGCRP